MDSPSSSPRASAAARIALPATNAASSRPSAPRPGGLRARASARPGSRASRRRGPRVPRAGRPRATRPVRARPRVRPPTRPVQTLPPALAPPALAVPLVRPPTRPAQAAARPVRLELDRLGGGATGSGAGRGRTRSGDPGVARPRHPGRRPGTRPRRRPASSAPRLLGCGLRPGAAAAEADSASPAWRTASAPPGFS